MPKSEATGVTWVEPELVGEVQVHRVDQVGPPAPAVLARACAQTRARGRSSLSPEQRTVIEVDGRRLSVSNLDKVLYPEAGFTKADVIWYYLHVAPCLLPHVEGRPLTMTRYPDGVTGKSFFEKHSARKAPEWARWVPCPQSAVDGGAGFIEQLVIDDLPTLIWVANLAALELHVPQWRFVSDGSYGPVDLIVFDLDPGAPASIVECCVVAGWLRAELAGRGLVAFPEDQRLQGPPAVCPAGPALAVGTAPTAKHARSPG